jgi:hypothetical protein
MTEQYKIRLQIRLKRIAEGKRNPTDYPMPQPTGPFSKNVVPITFESYRLARNGVGHPAVLKLFKTFGAFRIKPKRGSNGFIWNNRAYWWSPKGFYRPGNVAGPRPPLQHHVWETFHGQKMPPKHEIFFKDRNRNNFDRANLELLYKGDLHKRLADLGEVPQASVEFCRTIASRRWTRYSRNMTALLLKNFSTNGSTSLIKNLKKK